MADKIKKLPFDYVTKDYDGFFQYMKEQIPALTPEWTDTSDTDPGIVNLQLLAYGLHILGYQQEIATRENILSLAQTRESIIKLSRFLGREPVSQKPSVGEVTFTKYDTDIEDLVTIPKGTIVRTDSQNGDSVPFETTETIFIREGESSGTAPIKQGLSIAEEYLGTGNGEESQEFSLDVSDVITESLEIMTSDNGELIFWERVETFIGSGSDDYHYITYVDEQNITHINFGTGSIGVKPGKGVNVLANYRYGGGSQGNVEAGMIMELDSSTLTEIESVTNEERTTGGSDFEDLETTKSLAPRYYRMGGKVVTSQDLKDLVSLEFPSVIETEVEELFDLSNTVNLYVAMDDYLPMTQAFKDSIVSHLDDYLVMNQTVVPKDATYVDFDLNLTAYIEDNFLQGNVKMELENLILENFSPSNFGFGGKVFISQIIYQCFFARGVTNVVINNPTTDINTGDFEIPKLGAINITIDGGVPNA